MDGGPCVEPLVQFETWQTHQVAQYTLRFQATGSSGYSYWVQSTSAISKDCKAWTAYDSSGLQTYGAVCLNART
ncbi:hypothetical protein PanWU01x14_123380 [Parasponia andersonii]|uniref:Uncharacterized protein n=1 Tax=Parasponia andersonii TaxID=3476 RepID=A0A2P5CUK4_PARAD|nr:hypothetical protein PanWU01x14_123380 [Parasponia andersonii]